MKNIGNLLDKEFALEYLTKLKEAVCDSLIHSLEAHINNFVFNKCQKMMNDLDILLENALGSGKQFMTKELVLQISEGCLNSESLETKLRGFTVFYYNIYEKGAPHMANFITNYHEISTRILQRSFELLTHMNTAFNSEEYMTNTNQKNLKNGVRNGKDYFNHVSLFQHNKMESSLINAWKKLLFSG